jgi:menaquinol-cytochrome c reductase iron-sulfur subunit
MDRLPKMESVHPVSDTEVIDDIERRRFYLTFIYGLWALISAALAAPALLYLLLPPKVRGGIEWVDAGEVSQLQPKIPVERVFRRNRTDGWKITSEKETAWVVQLPDQKIVAFGPQCTHLGCAYHWEEATGEFLCPCHSSVFSLSGAVVSGPAPRPLDRYDVKIENGKLLLGTLRESTGQST